MAEVTEISWTDATFNPWIGCTKVSRAASGGGGCDHCYAEVSTPARVLRAKGAETWGTGATRVRTSAGNWKQPLNWNATPFYECAECSKPECSWRGEGDGRMCGACGGHVVPARRRVFCASLADVFDNEVDPAWRANLFELIEATPNLDWLLLTKRIGNAAKMMADACGVSVLSARMPLRNVWLGATIVNQDEADRDIPKLLGTPARVRFLSMEPLLAPVDLAGQWRHWNAASCEPGELPEVMIDWIIVGGESGPGARPMHPAWTRSLRDQCAAAGVAFHFKQWGEWQPISQMSNGDGPGCSDNPALTRVQRMVLQLDGTDHGPHAFPAGAMTMFKFGKKAAGRLLDGDTHDAFPEVRHG